LEQGEGPTLHAERGEELSKARKPKVASDQFARTGYARVPGKRVVVMFSNDIDAERFRNVDKPLAQEQSIVQGQRRRSILEISLYTDIRGQ